MTGLNVTQLKAEIVRPALLLLGLASDAAVNLVTGTALAESGAAFVRQIGGPALGLWQMEPATHDDCWNRFLAYFEAAPFVQALRVFSGPGAPTAARLVYDLRYGAAMCRIKYLRSPLSLPPADDAAGLSAYHKSVYNTAEGAANAIANTPLFQAAIDAGAFV